MATTTIQLATGPAQHGDAVDALLGELLDVQHDLADTVVWLAEHWPTDLPAPRLEPGTARLHTTAELWVQCATVKTLRRAADVLAAEIAPDRGLSGYMSARRGLGRVEIVAWVPPEVLAP
jgi:hypothetical protein